VNPVEIEECKQRLAMRAYQAAELEKQSAQNGGKLKRSEWWNLEYYRDPYLTLASQNYLSDRFIDHYHNCSRLTSGGQIAPHYEFSKDDGLLGPLFSHLNIEFSIRGGVPEETFKRANNELDKYFHAEIATGVQMFRSYPEKLENVIAKFGQKQHLVALLNNGDLRLTPANYYKRGSLLKAMRDLETEREFHIPQFGAALSGKNSIQVGDFDWKIQDGFAKIVKKCPEYLLWSACLDIDRRMPDDFGANAALVIRDPNEFTARLARIVKGTWPDDPIWFGPVNYFDPCSVVHHKTRPEQIKHFSFYYQREWRFCAFPREGKMPEEPILVSVGALNDIAELVTLE
jgi:hypothetical protein